jgi:uncharacterized protein (DUF952 family)
VTNAPRILHITSLEQWTAAQAHGSYTADSLAAEGFIHCSDPHQVMWVAGQRFRGRTDMVILHIDASKLNVDVRYENFEGGTQLFPHVYGPIPCTAVTDVTPLTFD